MRGIRLVGCLWVGTLSVVAVGSDAASFRGLGDLPGGSFFSRSNAVSPDGAWLVGSGSGDDGQGGTAGLAFRAAVAGGGPVSLGELPGGFVGSSAAGVSNGGSVVVGLSDSDIGGSGVEAFRWLGGTMTGLGDFPGGREASRALGVSADGAVVVGRGTSLRPGTSNPDGRGEAFRWTQGDGLVGLGQLPNVGLLAESAASDVSNDGSVVVGVSDSRFGATVGVIRNEAFRWTQAAGMVGLGDLSGGLPSSTANAVNADGSAVVGQSSSDFGVGGFGFEAFLWTEADGMLRLGDLPGGTLGSNANGVSADAQRIVGNSATDASTFLEAFLWQPDTGMRRLMDVLTDAGLGEALDGWTLVSANDISDDGTVIVGSGENPLGQTEAWVAVLPALSNGIAGDYNDSGTVEQGDLNLVLTNWGQAAPFAPNGDPFATAKVDQEELNRVLNNWGSAGVPNFQGFDIPEPATGVALGTLAMFNSRRRRNATVPRCA